MDQKEDRYILLSDDEVQMTDLELSKAIEYAQTLINSLTKQRGYASVAIRRMAEKKPK